MKKQILESGTNKSRQVILDAVQNTKYNVSFDDKATNI